MSKSIDNRTVQQTFRSRGANKPQGIHSSSGLEPLGHERPDPPFDLKTGQATSNTVRPNSKGQSFFPNTIRDQPNSFDKFSAKASASGQKSKNNLDLINELCHNSLLFNNAKTNIRVTDYKGLLAGTTSTKDIRS